MRKLLPLIVISCFAFTPGHAAALTLKINNKSGQAINSIMATPKSGGADISLLATAIAAGATGTANFTPPAGACVFTVKYTLASGKIITLPDTDLCQTDQIMVE
jgi:hypothetical protein